MSHTEGDKGIFGSGQQAKSAFPVGGVNGDEADRISRAGVVVDPVSRGVGQVVDLVAAVQLNRDFLTGVDIHAVVETGSGGGYPGLPLAIMKPDSSFTLLEPSRKKAEYLRIAIGELGLSNSII